jgi:hypothetical protein
MRIVRFRENGFATLAGGWLTGRKLIGKNCRQGGSFAVTD